MFQALPIKIQMFRFCICIHLEFTFSFTQITVSLNIALKKWSKILQKKITFSHTKSERKLIRKFIIRNGFSTLPCDIVRICAVGNNKKNFAMPNQNLYINAIYKRIQEQCECLNTCHRRQSIYQHYNVVCYFLG